MNIMKYMKYIWLNALVLILFSCTPKATKPVVSEPEVKESVSQVDPRCRTFEDIGYKKEEAYTAYILFKDEIKRKNYKAAYPIWQKAMRLAPKADGRKSYQFDDGADIYIHFGKEAEIDPEKSMWADSLKALYEQRRFCYGNSARIDAKEIYDLFYNFPGFYKVNRLYKMGKGIMDSEGTNTPISIINPFAKLLVEQVQEEQISIEEAKKYIAKTQEIVDHGLANCGKSCANWKIVESYTAGRFERLESVQGVFDCAYFEQKYYPMYQIYKQNSEDCEQLASIAARLKRADCGEDSAILSEVLATYKQQCMKNVSKGPTAVAYGLYREGKYEDAIQQFQTYLQTETNPENLAKFNFLIAKIYYRDLKDFPKSRAFARKALQSKPNWGEPLILIGKLYASSGPLCGPGRGWDSQIVTWPAIDKWEQAKSLDASVRSEANKLIAMYSKFMPAQEEIFLRPKVKEGGSFYVGCWIQEKTTARAAKK